MKLETLSFANLKDNKCSLIIKEDKHIILTNFSNECLLDFQVDKNVSLKLSIFLNSPDIKLVIHGKVYGNVNVYVGEFSSGKSNISGSIDLLIDSASCNWQLGSLATNNDDKCVDISINHLSANTTSLINNYGVTRDTSKLIFTGICKIFKGSKQSKANQNAKIMVFDEKSKGICKPILKIDDNDILASHAAVVGKISDDQLFYITSRGIDIDSAKKLVTFGYLKPILEGFDDTNKQLISNVIEGCF